MKSYRTSEGSVDAMNENTEGILPAHPPGGQAKALAQVRATAEGGKTGDRHRGSSHLLSPATPPDKRVRIRRFEELRSTETGDAQLISPA